MLRVKKETDKIRRGEGLRCQAECLGSPSRVFWEARLRLTGKAGRVSDGGDAGGEKGM